METTRLIHKLEVHPIELEMQSKELLKARAQEEALPAQYPDRYDFAPPGYFTLAVDGTILAANLTGARFLGSKGAQLLNQRFGLLAAAADRPVFNAFLEKAFAGKDGQGCEAALRPRENRTALCSRRNRGFQVPAGAPGRRVREVADRHRLELEQERLILELRTALARVILLSGRLPIRAKGNRIRNDAGYLNQVESYPSSHPEATFTPGHCRASP